MRNQQLTEIQRVFTSRLEALEHLLDIGEKHFTDANTFMGKRLAEDMFAFGGQIAFACNQPRGFSQWCAGQPIDNLAPDSIQTIEQARAAITQAKALVAGITVADSKLDETKRIGLGPGRW